ncbi:Metallo-dependent phosphatase [Cylindrobasidium torrendii FP15055 ss-10]|uniref:Vacuolar protein sorting-associated protein 29 n=1 Tax=Cylindrobasidium torrendii FP15055 ss-10 TaxID=1314674 RepID=A0A0D7BFQ0_9AGAR|nr:Metallo-dependent phosphatase [Cylindrobasidium torrendii FP15055 ss-10]
MPLVLVIGDLHIPHRIHDLPVKFKKLLVPGKIQQILCTGNVCDRETYEYLRTISPDVHVVAGDYDDNPAFPASITVNHQPIRIGVIHGHQSIPVGDLSSLSSIARQMDVDVLISGHTHAVQATGGADGRFYLNPGSATGAWTGLTKDEPTPSFALMDIQGPVVVTYVYHLQNGEVRVDKVEWRKEARPTPQPTSGPGSPQPSAASIGGGVWG